MEINEPNPRIEYTNIIQPQKHPHTKKTTTTTHTLNNPQTLLLFCFNKCDFDNQTAIFGQIKYN